MEKNDPTGPNLRIRPHRDLLPGLPRAARRTRCRVELGIVQCTSSMISSREPGPSATIVVRSAAGTSCESLTSHSCSSAARAPCSFRARARGPASRAPRAPSRASAPRCPSRVSRRTPRLTTSKPATTLRRSPHEPSRSMRHRRNLLPPRRRFGRRCKARSTGSSAKARRADATNTVGRQRGNRHIRPNCSDPSLEEPSRSPCWFGRIGSRSSARPVASDEAFRWQVASESWRSRESTRRPGEPRPPRARNRDRRGTERPRPARPLAPQSDEGAFVVGASWGTDDGVVGGICRPRVRARSPNHPLPRSVLRAGNQTSGCVVSVALVQLERARSSSCERAGSSIGRDLRSRLRRRNENEVGSRSRCATATQRIERGVSGAVAQLRTERRSSRGGGAHRGRARRRFRLRREGADELAAGVRMAARTCAELGGVFGRASAVRTTGRLALHVRVGTQLGARCSEERAVAGVLGLRDSTSRFGDPSCSIRCTRLRRRSRRT